MTKHVKVPFIGEIGIPLLSDKKKVKNTQNKADAKDISNIHDISGNEILVRVYKDFGSNTEILKAEYFAVERRDAYNNLISINEDYSHNHDTDFLIDDVYREMQIILEFANKSKDYKIKLLEQKISRQDKLLRYLEKFPKLNAAYNYCDEDLKSRDYKILLTYIKNHDGQGAYFTIEHGKRVYSFLACEGYLAPIWHGIDNYTQYPDHTRKLKITIQEDMRMRQEIEEYNKNKKVGNIIVWGLIITVVLFGLNVWAATWLWGQNTKLHDKIYNSAYECAELTSQLNANYAELVKETVLDPNKPQYVNGTVVQLRPTTIK